MKNILVISQLFKTDSLVDFNSELQNPTGPPPCCSFFIPFSPPSAFLFCAFWSRCPFCWWSEPSVEGILPGDLKTLGTEKKLNDALYAIDNVREVGNFSVRQ